MLNSKQSSLFIIYFYGGSLLTYCNYNVHVQAYRTDHTAFTCTATTNRPKIANFLATIGVVISSSELDQGYLYMGWIPRARMIDGRALLNALNKSFTVLLLSRIDLQRCLTIKEGDCHEISQRGRWVWPYSRTPTRALHLTVIE